MNWRETWKYGERAFRYCQHDVGHAIGSARIAAQTLGWRMLLLNGLADDTVATLLGLDRLEDFEGAEREHPDCLAVVWPADQAAGLSTGKTIAFPLSLAPDAVRKLTARTWHGKANRLSRDDPVPWEILNQVEVTSWKSSTERSVVELNHDSPFRGEPDGPDCPCRERLPWSAKVRTGDPSAAKRACVRWQDFDFSQQLLHHAGPRYAAG